MPEISPEQEGLALAGTQTLMAGWISIREGCAALVIAWGVLAPGFGLAGMSDNAPTNENPALPADTNVVQGRFATLQSAFAGSPELEYQWFLDRGLGAEAILHATNASHVIGPMTTADAGDYFVRATIVGESMSADSRPARVVFVPDFTPPVIQAAYWLDDYSILVQFDEALDLDPITSGTTDPFGYAVRPLNAPVWSVSFVQPTNSNTAVILGGLFEGTMPAVREPWGYYTMTVYSGYVSDPFGNFIDSDTYAGVMSESTLLPLDAVWFYNEAGMDLGPAWFAPPVDTSAPGWQAGPGVLGHESAGPVVPLIRTDLTAPTEGGPDRAYFVTRFLLPVELQAVFDLRLRYFLDDGAIVYLNGVEVHRQRILPERVVPVGEAELEGPFSLTNFVEGVNELAVEVRQAGIISEDVVWGARVTALLTQTIPPPMPRIAVQPSDVLGHEGGAATFGIVAIGTLPLQYQWQHNEVDLPNQTNAWLFLENLTTPDAGLYRVRVRNTGGSVWSQSATLIVRPLLAIRHLPDGNVELSWGSGSWTLLQSEAPAGLYTLVPGNPSSPFILAPTSPGLFFQLRSAP